MTNFDSSPITHLRRKTSKLRRCDWCGDFIRGNTQYKKFASAYEGDFTAYMMHVKCYDNGWYWVSSAEDFEWRGMIRGGQGIRMMYNVGCDEYL